MTRSESGKESLFVDIRLVWARHLERTGRRLDRKVARLNKRANICYDLAHEHRMKTLGDSG